MEFSKRQVKVEAPRRFLPGRKTYVAGSLEVPAYGWSFLSKYAVEWFAKSGLMVELGFFGYGEIYLGVMTEKSSDAQRVFDLLPQMLFDFTTRYEYHVQVEIVEAVATMLYEKLDGTEELPLTLSVQSYGGDVADYGPSSRFELPAERHVLVERLRSSPVAGSLAYVNELSLDRMVPEGTRLIVKVKPFLPEVVHNVHSALEGALAA